LAQEEEEGVATAAALRLPCKNPMEILAGSGKSADRDLWCKHLQNLVKAHLVTEGTFLEQGEEQIAKVLEQHRNSEWVTTFACQL
jgi:hypothetical protein